MIKTHSPYSWPSLSAPALSQIKVGRYGLRGADKEAFSKIASMELVDTVAKIKFEPGEIPIHLMSHGASERWGYNYNGDGFSKLACIEHHKTFETSAKIYRNHKNTDPLISYGVIKYAFFDHDRQTVELIAALNATKSAADRNQGFVADKEMQLLESGKDLGVSMACKIAQDTCIHCGNNAPNRKFYCDGPPCPIGGVKYQLGKLVKKANEIVTAAVENRHPHWFDMSIVDNPAMAAAYGNKIDYVKFASLDYDVAKTHPDWRYSPVRLGRLMDLSDPFDRFEKIAADLASIEGLKTFLSNTVGADLLLNKSGFPVDRLARWGTKESAEQLAALADRGVILSIKDYARYSNHVGRYKQASTMLPMVYRLLTSTNFIPEAYTKEAGLIMTANPKHSCIDKVISRVRENSILDDNLIKRAVESKLRPAQFAIINREETIDDDDFDLVLSYTGYKTAATSRMTKDLNATVTLTKCAVLLQNSQTVE